MIRKILPQPVSLEKPYQGSDVWGGARDGMATEFLASTTTLHKPRGMVTFMMANNPSEEQTPGPGEIFLDHVGWFVPDIDQASSAFELLGFPLTPFTIHMNEHPDGSRLPSGTANRCAMIRRGYLEILTRLPDVDSAITQQMDAGLARYTGLHLIAFTVSDTDAFTRRLRQQGFDPDLPVALRRPMPMDDGSEKTAAFSVVRLPSDAMAEGRVQALSQDTPDIVWQPSLIARENGAEMLSGVLIASPDPTETAQRYEKFTSRTKKKSEFGYSIALDRGTICVCSEVKCSELLVQIDIPSLPFIAAVSISCKDMSETRSFLHERNVPLLSDEPQKMIVERQAGVGAALVFHASDTPPFP
ncbi:MAG: VOC family protein [Pseudomonadota bacterium]|nr:VOC family protein [Pseudomonadota bacterium]